MPNHMLLMSFDKDNLINLFTTLDRFFEYCISILQKKTDINFCYIGTAANDRLIDRLFFSGFIKSKFGRSIRTSKLMLTKKITQHQIETHLASQDILFIGGGNTEQMLKIWENKGFSAVLNKLKKEDRLPLLAGVSAGGMYPFHSGLSDATPGQYKPLHCLEWLKQSFCPHANSKRAKLCVFDENNRHERFSAYKTAVQRGHLPSGYAVPDNCMLHFYNDTFVSALTTQESDICSYVTSDEIKPIETFHLTKQNTHFRAQDILASLGLKKNVSQRKQMHKPKWWYVTLRFLFSFISHPKTL